MPINRAESQDVTQRADEIQRLLAAIVAFSDDAIISKRLDGIITSWNAAAERLFGYSCEEAIGQQVSLIIPPELEQEEVEIIEKLSQGLHIEHYETVRVTKDGRCIDVSLSIFPIKDLQGTISGAGKIVRDISQQKALERKLQEQEHFLSEVSKVLASTLDYQETLSNIARLIVPKLADWFAVHLVDGEGHFELIEIEHHDPEKVQLVRDYFGQFPIHPDAPTSLPYVARTGHSELHREFTEEMLVAAAKTKAGIALAHKIGLRAAMNVPLVARGKIIGVVTFMSSKPGKRYDERDLALAEEVGRRAGIALDNARLYREVQQAYDQMAIILQGVADGIIVFDKSCRIIYANETAAKMAGTASVEELKGSPGKSWFAKYEVIDEQGCTFPFSRFTHQRVLAGEQEAEAIMGCKNKATGKLERWLLTISRPVADAQGETLYVIMIMHDITERVQVEHRKDEFISMASHELKTPVTSLKGFTYVLRRLLSIQGDEQGQFYLSRMDTQLDKLTKLISELLDISRMQSGKLELQQTKFDLDTFITETVGNVQMGTSTHRLLIEGNVKEKVCGDQDRLEQVLINLLANAIKYSPRADRVIVHVSREQEHAIVRVQDFGIGIDEMYQHKIFERFYQVSDAEENTYPGLGIGLYIAKEIVERHNGWIEVESRKGEGATFSVILPLLKEEN
jgi:PAS domain S-box-containing protein